MLETGVRPQYYRKFICLSHVLLAAEAAGADVDVLFIVGAAAAVLGVSVVDQVSEKATSSHVTGATDDRRRRRVVRQAKFTRRTV